MIGRRLQLLGLALFGAVLALGSGAARAAETQVAVAANFTEPAKAIAAAFRAATGHTAVLSFGSSGQFYAQMAHGAPYEAFLSADADRPKQAERDGLGVAGTRFTYAVGRLVLYSKTPGLVDGGGAVLSSGRFNKLSIADPAAAPYGLAAVQTMQKLGVYNAIKPKIVTGSSITQAYQFVDTGAAELGFVAYSQVINVAGGSSWLVPAADHAPIDQQAILLHTGENNPAAKAFLTFLKSPAAVAIIRKYGYEAR
ncbi:molybdate ABC transporter substrate-binding protein [Phenylobacterium sp.]|uniref:molybdate ABC transporter substrate-binding protein n=1 Tax=Phenylobacterium sp. TaxID=1871053 RepID=UPI0026151FAC|nr:molybdate ABC transporter substrate-binding protein [Phenylobacterium sp.]